MTRHDHHHHHSFGLGPGARHSPHVLGGGPRSRNDTADSEASFLSIRNLGDAPDLDDDVDVVRSAVRAMSLRRGRGDGAPGEGAVGGGGGGGGGAGGGPPYPPPLRTSRQQLSRRLPSFDGVAGSLRGPFSPSSPSESSLSKGGGTADRVGGRARAWTADDAADLPRGLPPFPGGAGASASAMPADGTPGASSTEVAASSSSSPSLPIRPRPFSHRPSRSSPSSLDVPPEAVPGGMTPQSASSWLAMGRSGGGISSGGGAPRRSERSWEVFRDEYSHDGEEDEEEKREITASDEELGGGGSASSVAANTAGDNLGGSGGGGGALRGLSTPPLSPRTLPPRNEAHIEGDSFRAQAHSGGLRGALPPTIAEEEHLPIGDADGPVDADADAGDADADADAVPPASEELAAAQSSRGYQPCFDSGNLPIGSSRLLSLCETERDNVLMAAKWASTQSIDSMEDDRLPRSSDGFVDEGLPWRDDADVSDAPPRATAPPRDPERAVGFHDDIDNISHHSGLGSRHGGYGRKPKKKKKRGLNRVLSSASVPSDKAVGGGGGGGGDGDGGYRRVYLCGRAVPCLRWPPLRLSGPSWSRVSSAIVRNAPCFWCSRRFETAATDRAILIRLNIMCAVFAAVQVGAGLFVLIVQGQLRMQNLMNFWISNVPLLGLAGLVLLITMLLALRVIRDMILAGALRYMWALYWLLPVEILLVIGLFDINRASNVWVKHLWASPPLDWFREWLCYNGTSHTKCIVPIGGGEDYVNETGWCLAEYNATDCQQIRDDAQENMVTATTFFSTANGIWGLLLIVLLSLADTLLEGIITAPIVQSSKQANVPFWLTLPITGCALGGYLLLFAPSTTTGQEGEKEVIWIGAAFFTCAGTFFIAALLGWFISAFSVLNNREKRRKQIAIMFFNTILMLTALMVVAIFIASLFFTTSIVDIEFDDSTRGDIACNRYSEYVGSCTHCDREVNRCPEWTNEDLVIVLQTQLKQAATLAAITVFCAISALRFGFVLRKHFSRYQIDYV